MDYRLGLRLNGKASHAPWRNHSVSPTPQGEGAGEAFFIGQKMITQERLMELLHYDQITGVFTRKVQTCSRVKIGMVAGCADRHGHLLCHLDGKRYSMHRLAWLYMTGSFPDGEIDHISGEKSDNRFSNLRDVNRATNMQNIVRASSNNKTGLLGVVANKKLGNFMARIRVDGRNMHLGTFKTADDAHIAYLNAKRKFHNGCTI